MKTTYEHVNFKSYAKNKFSCQRLPIKKDGNGWLGDIIESTFDANQQLTLPELREIISFMEQHQSTGHPAA